MIIRQYKLKDIKNYEDTTHESILDFIFKPSFHGTVTLVSLGNNCINLDDAGNLLDNYIAQGHTFFEVLQESQKLLLGEKSVDTEAKEEEVIDISKFKTLTDLYNHFYLDIFKGTNRVSYIEFWELTTTDMYRLFDIINIQKINEFNEELYKMYIAAGLNGAGHWGKLPKHPPTVKIPKNKKESKEEKQNRLKMEVAQLKSMGQLHNAAIIGKRGGMQ